ncbi:hypothetical protein CASFOL_022716 [Castilleja foliolosa]|uniref:Uncharacterized protein n=1 Tax=Castilleja foliolosa TaxID=1961234 RepID=A0ABD3CXU9_9LAMI
MCIPLTIPGGMVAIYRLGMNTLCKLMELLWLVTIFGAIMKI